MGFVTSSSTIQLYAYITQYARDRIINGDINEFTVTHFSLHDDDINYKIASKEIATDATGGTIYNLVSSGFIPDITGDIDNCVKSLAKGVAIKGSFLNNPIPSTEQTYTITTNKPSVNKNESVIYTITTQNVPNGTLIFWETDSANTCLSSDFSDGQSNGSFLISNNQGTITRTILNNYSSLVDKTIVLKLRSVSVVGQVLKTAPTVRINNTSSSQNNPPAGQVYVQNDPLTINRNTGKESLRTATFTLSTQNYPVGTVFYWENIGSTVSSDFFGGANNGYLSATVGTYPNASTTLSRLINQSTIPQDPKTIEIRVRENSPTGTIVGTSPIVNVNVI